MRYWLWLGKLGPAGGFTQQLCLFQDNSGTPHYFWCTIDFIAIKSWRFQTWLKCQISIKKKKKDTHKMGTSWRCSRNTSPLPHFLITISNKFQRGIFLWCWPKWLEIINTSTLPAKFTHISQGEIDTWCQCRSRTTRKWEKQCYHMGATAG